MNAPIHPTFRVEQEVPVFRLGNLVAELLLVVNDRDRYLRFSDRLPQMQMLNPVEYRPNALTKIGVCHSDGTRPGRPT